MSRAAQSTRGYDNTGVSKISHREAPSSYQAEVVISNTGNVFTALDLEHYQAVISYGYNTGVARSTWAAASTYAIDDIVIPSTANGYQYRCSIAGTAGASEPTFPTALGVTVADSAVTWEMDGKSGEEYARTAPLRVRVQELHSGMGVLKCVLRCSGLLDQLNEDNAINKYDQTSADTQTVQDLINRVADAGTALSSAYTTYSAVTMTYDSTDSIITSFKPAEYFGITVNESRLDKIQGLLEYTGCKMRQENDNKIHVLDPVTTGTAYNEEYKFNVAGDHNFWNEGVRLRFVDPNREIVSTPTEFAPSASFAGTATSTASYDLAPKTHTTYRRVTSTAEASSVASAIIERYELDAEKGFVTVPMQVAQELWDYVQITDSRMGGTTRVGNVQYLQRDVEIHLDGKPVTWQMLLSLGKITQQSLMAAADLGVISDNFKSDITERVDKILDYTKWLGNKVNDHTDQLRLGGYPYKLKPAITRWVMPGWNGYVGSKLHVASRIYYTPIFVEGTTTYIRIGAHVTVAATGTCDLRIFNWSDGLPGSLVLSAGTVDTGTTGDKEITISQTLSRGYYFLASRCSAAPTLWGLQNESDGPVGGFGDVENDVLSETNMTVLAADAAYADPAPAPTKGFNSLFAAVRLREN